MPNKDATISRLGAELRALMIADMKKVSKTGKHLTNKEEQKVKKAVSKKT